MLLLILPLIILLKCGTEPPTQNSYCKKIEARLHEKYPDKWIPAYSQVTFSPHIRYSEALQRGQRQEAIMQEVMKMEGLGEVG